jgi:tetratricopeptide (TPR) repeat protein
VKLKRMIVPFLLAACVIGAAVSTLPASADDAPSSGAAPVAANAKHEAAEKKAATTSADAKTTVKPAAAAKSAGVDSLALLERAVAKDSTKWENTYRLGVMLLDRDRVTDAALVLERAHKSKPTDVPTLVNLGAAYDAIGKAPLAQSHYRKALELSPENEMAMCRLAQSLYATSEHQEAMDLLRDVIHKKPNAHCAYFTLGVAFADAGIYKDAVRMWKKVVELAPESPEAISAKESISVLESVINTTN